MLVMQKYVNVYIMIIVIININCIGCMKYDYLRNIRVRNKN